MSKILINSIFFQSVLICPVLLTALTLKVEIHIILSIRICPQINVLAYSNNYMLKMYANHCTLPLYAKNADMRRLSVFNYDEKA